jgi:ssDNA-binding Zn-finger/Zn-ribbon topoisomerase 1
MKFNTSVKVEYDKDKTILRCTKCGQEQIEWYNDQPGDPCSNYKPDCDGKMVRVIKRNLEFKIGFVYLQYRNNIYQYG